MVKLRLTRTGRKNNAQYRIIAIDARRKRESKALEELGFYLPHDKQVSLNADRVNYWLSVGAQPTDTVQRLLVKQGLLPASVLPKKKFAFEAGKKSKDRAAKKAEKAEAAKKPKVEEKQADEVEAEAVTPTETTEAAE